MEHRVQDLARLAGVSVDTIRFYQGRGLLPPPRRRGRVAVYDDSHLARLRRIRAWLRAGLSLAVIRRLLDGGGREADEALLEAVAKERVGERTLSRAELAAESGVPEALIAAASAANLVTPLRVAGEERFSEADLEMARAGLAILSGGFPLDELLRLAVDHANGVRGVAERAIDLFDRHVRQAPGAALDAERVTRAFRQLIPQVTRLVALHFQRTLVSRALERLEGREELAALAEALAAVESSQLEVKWR
jgi:DNA-binding transcriptional MerR regulator